MKSGLKYFLLMVCFCCFAAVLQAEPISKTSLDSWGRMVILHDGRLKPLESFARHKLLQYSGRTSVRVAKDAKLSALQWLARVVFTPQVSLNDAIFLVNDPAVLEALGIVPAKNRRYSFQQFQEHFHELERLYQQSVAMDSADRGAMERSLITLYANLNDYLALTYSLQYAEDRDEFVVGHEEVIGLLGLPPKANDRYSFWDLFSKVHVMRDIILPLKDKPKEELSETEEYVFRWAGFVLFWLQNIPQTPWRVLPPLKPGDLWTTPMAVLARQGQFEHYATQVSLWRDMMKAYQMNDNALFISSVERFKQALFSAFGEPLPLARLAAEHLYLTKHPFLWAKLCYVLAFFLGLAFLAYSRRWLYQLVLGLLVIGFVWHAVGLGLRIFILMRPPVSTLYETFLFVGLLCVALAFVVEYFLQKGLGLIVGAVSGYILLMIAAKYAMEGDTLKVLEAVLNSNFWLSTHVLAISSGYALCALAGVMGHVYLIQRYAFYERTALYRKTNQVTYGLLAVGLILSFLGTVLGGIWADQSWGRFWGWDPKENGALLIVLWIAMIFHARWAGLIRDKGLALGAIGALICVVLAWFGVNLLGVGLHSYGFTSGALRNMVIFIVLECVFVLVMTFLLWFRQNRPRGV